VGARVRRGNSDRTHGVGRHRRLTRTNVTSRTRDPDRDRPDVPANFGTDGRYQSASRPVNVASVMEGSLRRRIAVPVALLAALAIGAGGSSSPWALSPANGGRSDRAAAPAGPATVQLAHLELVALRAQLTPGGAPR
jgi:hypothetical protein